LLGRLAGWRADLAAVLLGMLSAAALPPFFVLPVLLISIPGLLALIDGSRTPWVAVRRGFWFAWGNHILGLYWITEAILFEAARFWWLVPLAVPGLSAILAPFTAAACGVARLATPGWRRALALAGAWVLADLARQFVGTGFPWNLWGSVWAMPGLAGDVMLQPAAWVSVHGLTLVTILLAATPALGLRAMLAGLTGLVLWAGAGWWRLGWAAGPAPDLSVVLVQGNIPQGRKWDRAFVDKIFRRHLALSDAAKAGAAGGHPAVVVWPETSSPFLLAQDANARAAIADAAGSALPDGRPAIVGSVRYDEQGRPRNSLMVVDGPGPVLAMYDKWHLVPFGEYQPSWMPLPIQVVPGGGFGFGDGPQTLHVRGLPAFGPFICYEAIFPGQVIDERDRPDWMVNITNDAWFGNSTGPRQHLAAVQTRAVEEGLPVMRAANSGITAGFDAHGRELGRLPMSTDGALVLQLPGKLPPTLFSRGGLLIPAALAIAVLAGGIVPVRRRRDNEAQA